MGKRLCQATGGAVFRWRTLSTIPTNLEINMISLLGSLLGFGSSLIGPVLDAWNRSADQKHELAMLHAQAEIQSKVVHRILNVLDQVFDDP